MAEQLKITSFPSSEDDRWAELKDYKQPDLAPQVDNPNLASDQLELSYEEALKLFYRLGLEKYCELHQMAIPDSIVYPECLPEESKQCEEAPHYGLERINMLSNHYFNLGYKQASAQNSDGYYTNE